MARVNYRAFLHRIEPTISRCVDRLPSHENDLKLQADVCALALENWLVDPDLLHMHRMERPAPLVAQTADAVPKLDVLRRKQLSASAKDWARSVVRQCEKKQVVTGVDLGNNRAFTKADSVVLLMVLFLLRNSDLFPVHAIRIVEDFLSSQPSDSAGLMTTLVDLSWKRVESFVRDRIYKTAVTCAFLDPLPVPFGALVLMCPLTAGQAPTNQSDMVRWLKSLYLNAPKHFVYIAAESSELLPLERPVIMADLATRRFVFTRVRAEESEYAIVVAVAGSRQETAVEYKEAHPERSVLLCDLLDLVTCRLPSLERTLQGLVNPVLNDPSPDLSHRGLAVWIMTQIVCLAASPQGSTAARCIIYEPLVDPRSGKTDYRCAASSELRPNANADGVPAPLEPFRLLSGYASATHLTLGVPLTKDPFDMLVPFHVGESGAGPERLQTCIAVPLPAQGGTPASVLYTWLPHIADASEYHRRIRCLQVLAPFVGELLQEAESTRLSADSARQSLCAECLSETKVREALEHRVSQLLAERPALPSPRDYNERLAVILLSAQPSASGNWRWAADWLREQLALLVPSVFVEPWLNAESASLSLEPFIYGQGAADATFTLMLIPAWLTKERLERLRAALPIRLNLLPYAQTKKAGDSVRLNVWMVDFRRGLLGENATAAVATMLDQCRASAKVMKHLVQADLSAHKHGDLSKALDIVLDGLEVDPGNTFLVRLAAEYNLHLGRFREALSYIDEAVCQSPTSVSVLLLRGKAYLGLGRLLDSLHAYASAAAVDPLHPLPAYYTGQAVLAAARIVRQWLFDGALEAVKQNRRFGSAFGERTRKALLDLATALSLCVPEDTDANCADVVEELCRKLSNHAWIILKAALASLRNWGELQATPDVRTFEWFSCLYSIDRAVQLKSDTEEAVRKLRSTIAEFPTGSDLLLQELQFTLMRHNPRIPEQLLSDLATPGTLQWLEELSRKHQA